MIEELFSPHWYRIKDLKPLLKNQVGVSCQKYRNQSWYIIKNPSSTHSHRVSEQGHQFIQRMDGERSVEQIWAQCNASMGDDSPSQGDIIQLLARLHAADLMLSDVCPGLEELVSRGRKRDQAQRTGYFKNPAALRFPLLDPDTFLNNTVHFVRPLFALLPLCLLAVAIIIAGVQAAVHWPELSHAISTQTLQPYNLLLLFFLYPLIKLLHELGHAYSVKLEGGEVHELGVMLLVLMPIPYVDASASSTFTSRRKRILVSAAGMIVELALSAGALFLWLLLENGLVRDIALNVALIGGVSTLLFNGNPLLRYDAYYMLSDWLGIPNFSQRANQYIAYLCQRYLFGMQQAQSPQSAHGERFWFVLYAISSFVYRTVLMLSISLYLASKMFVLGVVLALWLLFNQFALPLAKIIRFLFSQRLGLHGHRARFVSATGVLALTLFITAVPMPSNTVHEGVVWLPGDARIHSDVEAVIKRVLVKPGQQVVQGQGLFELDNPELNALYALEAAKLRELLAVQTKLRVSDTVRALAMQERIVETQARLLRAEEKLEGLLIRSPNNGELAIPNADDLPGSFIQQGDLLAYLKNEHSASIQLVVHQADQDRIQQGIERVQVRLASQPDAVIHGQLAHTTPQASNVLPSPVLGTTGGGVIAVDPNDKHGTKSLNALFQYELNIPLAVHDALLGSRAYVRFDHGSETVSEQLVRRTRQLFLKHFDA